MIPEILELARQVDISSIATHFIGLSISNLTSIADILLLPAVMLTTTSTSSPGLASQLPKSNVISAADAFLFAETSTTSSILTLGCETDKLPAALTDEVNAPVMSDKLMTADVTAESSFFISAFSFPSITLY